MGIDEQCPKNSLKRLYTFEGLLVLVEKASFSRISVGISQRWRG